MLKLKSKQLLADVSQYTWLYDAYCVVTNVSQGIASILYIKRSVAALIQLEI